MKHRNRLAGLAALGLLTAALAPGCGAAPEEAGHLRIGMVGEDAQQFDTRVAGAADHDAVDAHVLLAGPRIRLDLGRSEWPLPVEEGLEMRLLAVGGKLEVQRRARHQCRGGDRNRGHHETP